MRHIFILLTLLFSFSFLHAGEITIATLNTMWFFNPANPSGRIATPDKPVNAEEYELKAGHLAGLLPKTAPLLIGLQEVGDISAAETLAAACSRRYGRSYATLFIKGKDTQTGQNVAFLFDASQGWKIRGREARPSELEKELTKHLVVAIDGPKGEALNACVIHLRRPIGKDGEEKQASQIQALLRWAFRFLGKNPQANVILLGDANVATKPDDPTSVLTPLTNNGFVDAVWKIKNQTLPTHGDGKAFDRILVSPSLVTGASGLQLIDAEPIPHSHAKKKDPMRKTYTDHFCVFAKFKTSD